MVYKKQSNSTTFNVTGYSWIKVLRRYWLALTVVLFSIFLVLVDAPAWAAPASGPLYQTVPRPTSTKVESSSPSPDPAATPRPDTGGSGGSDGDGSGSSSGGSNNDSSSNEGSDSTSSDTNDIIISGGSGGGGASSGGAAMPVDSAEVTGAITAPAVNVREGPGTDFTIVGSVYLDDPVAVAGESEEGSWLFVCCASGTELLGWVDARYVELDGKTSVGQEALVVDSSEERASDEASAPAAQSNAQEGDASTPTPALALTVTQSDPLVWQGQTLTLDFAIVNEGEIAAQSVELSDELPADLRFVDATISDGGQLLQETTPDGNTIFVVAWPTLLVGQKAQATVTLQVAPDAADGAVIRTLAALRAADSPSISTAINLGMPPTTLPTFK